MTRLNVRGLSTSCETSVCTGGGATASACSATLDWTVCHIAADGGLTEHQLPPFAIVQSDKSVRYPPTQAALPGL